VLAIDGRRSGSTELRTLFSPERRIAAAGSTFSDAYPIT
jgi:hypothetical protein